MFGGGKRNARKTDDPKSKGPPLGTHIRKVCTSDGLRQKQKKTKKVKGVKGRRGE